MNSGNAMDSPLYINMEGSSADKSSNQCVVKSAPDSELPSSVVKSCDDQSKERIEDKLVVSVVGAVVDTLWSYHASASTIRGKLHIDMDNGDSLTLSFPGGCGDSQASLECSPTGSKRKAYLPRKISESTNASTSTRSSPDKSRDLMASMSNPEEKEHKALDLSVGNSGANSGLNTPLKQPQEQLSLQQQLMLQPWNILTIPNLELFAGALAKLAVASSMTSAATDHPSGCQEQPLEQKEDAAMENPSPPPAKRARTSGGDDDGGGGGSRRSTGSRANRRFTCNLCPALQFGSLLELEHHTQRTHGKYECHYCHAKFTQRSNLQRHALRHVGFKPFCCRLCERAYFRKDHLMRHMASQHPNISNASLFVDVRLTSAEALDFLRSHLDPQPAAATAETGSVAEQRRSGDQAEDTHLTSPAAASSSGVSSSDGINVDSHSSLLISPTA